MDSIPSIISSIIVAIALIFTAKTYFKMRHTEQVKISHDVFKMYLELEKESAKLKEEGNKSEQRTDWVYRFFNTLEWVSLLINSKEITNERLIGFYQPIINSAYKDILPNYYSNNEIDKEYIYPEFQQLYQSLKDKKVKFYEHKKPSP
jgi:hypothetical protein